MKCAQRNAGGGDNAVGAFAGSHEGFRRLVFGTPENNGGSALDKNPPAKSPTRTLFFAPTGEAQSGDP